MNAKRSAVLVAVAAIFLLTSCSGTKNRCVTNCGGNGDATLSLTLAAVPLTPPPGTSILSFVVIINSVSLTPSAGGSAVAINLNSGSYSVDLTRLQSDSSFLGIASASVPAGTYNQVKVGITNAIVTYCAATSGTQGCNTGSIVQLSSGPGTPATSNFSLTLTSNQQAALRVQINFNNALTVNTGTQAATVNLGAANVVTTASLPLATSTLAAGQQDFVDDVTGVVTAASNSSVTVQTATQGTITAAINNSSLFGPSCVIPPTAPAMCTNNNIPSVGQVASIDAVLNSDGTGTLLVYDPISASSIDLIEGVDTTLNAFPTQFQIVTNAIVRAQSGSLIGSLNLGDTVNATLANNAQQFVIDSHGLTVPAGSFTGNSATSILPGQTVALHVTSFTAKSGNTPASATVDIVVLRFTRVAGTVSGSGATFNIGSLPPFFGQTGTSQVQLSSGSPSTELDGFSTPTDITSGGNVSIRALYFGPNSIPVFSAAKVRKN